MRRFALLVPGLALGLLLGTLAQAGDKVRPELRAVADAYAESGDLDAALAALKQAHATPQELLDTLRAPARPADDPVPGVHTVDLKDGHGRATDLLIVAPTAEQIKAHAQKGLGLVVCLHGLGGSSRQAQNVATRLAATGDVVAVAPSAKPLPQGEGTDDDGIPELFKNKHWWAYENPRSFPLEAIRVARSLYPIDTDRILLSGMSMGGYGTWNIGLRRPDIFAGLAPLAGEISRFSVTSDQDAISKALCENARNTPILSIHGDADSIVPYKPDKEACDYINSIGGKAELRTLPGINHDLQGVHQGRTENGDYLCKWLVQQHRTSSPLAVTYVDVADRLDGAYWLRVATRESGVKYPRLQGTIDRAKNRISVEATGVELARIYIDDRLLDLKKPVAVAIGTGTRVKKKLEPEFRAILESWRSRRDENLVYPAFVEVDPRAVQ
jgi:poly(3-hydroxybutyrate) depolymerase